MSRRFSATTVVTTATSLFPLLPPLSLPSPLTTPFSYRLDIGTSDVPTLAYSRQCLAISYLPNNINHTVLRKQALRLNSNYSTIFSSNHRAKTVHNPSIAHFIRSLAITPSQLVTDIPLKDRPRCFPPCEMADKSGSAPFQALSFESALQAYQKKTGITLAQHPIAVDLQSCRSVGDVTTLLQGLALAVSDFRERDRMMKAIETTVTLLTPLSDSTSVTDAVRQKWLMA